MEPLKKSLVASFLIRRGSWCCLVGRLQGPHEGNIRHLRNSQNCGTGACWVWAGGRGQKNSVQQAGDWQSVVYCCCLKDWSSPLGIQSEHSGTPYNEKKKVTVYQTLFISSFAKLTPCLIKSLTTLKSKKNILDLRHHRLKGICKIRMH